MPSESPERNPRLSSVLELLREEDRELLLPTCPGVMASNVLQWQCPICSCTSRTLKLHVSHLRLVHSKDTAFSMMCGVDGCREVFRAFSAFNSHIYRHHRQAIGVSSNEDESTTQEEFCNESGSVLNSHEDTGEIEVPGIVNSGVLQSSGGISETAPGATEEKAWVSQREAAAKFVLALREGRQISQAAVADVMCGCKELCQQTSEALKDNVQHCLANVGIDLEQIPGLSDVFDTDINPFHGIDTNHLFEKFCYEHLGCLVSLSLSLSLSRSLACTCTCRAGA